MKNLTIAEYEALDYDHQLGWWPRYKAWRTKKIREYADCDWSRHFLGWEEIQVPVGPILDYYWRKPTVTEQTMHMMQPRIVDELLKSSVLSARIIGSKPQKWDKS